MLPRAKTLYIYLSLWVMIVRHPIGFIPSSHIPFWRNGEEIVRYPVGFCLAVLSLFGETGRRLSGIRLGLFRAVLSLTGVLGGDCPVSGWVYSEQFYPLWGRGELLKKILKSIINSKKLYFERIIK